MTSARLADYFVSVAAKRLSAVEVDPTTSNQHEFNGVASLRRMLGNPGSKVTFPTRFIYFGAHDDEPIIEDEWLTWYDARERHPTRTEWRLYFPTTAVSECAEPGDLMVIGRRPDDTLLMIIAESESTIANQIAWLFGFTDISPGYSVKEELETDQDRLGLVERLILESLGIEVAVTEETYLDRMLHEFSGSFPSTRIFSAFARSASTPVDVESDPDGAILSWMDKEEILFRTLERHLVAERLQRGFDADVDGFLSYSLAVQNRRKSRAGLALENHVEHMLTSHGIRFCRSAITENKSRPDFLFPSSDAYHDPSFPTALLTSLAVKSSCKERWRQVLSEADRIAAKHLLTLESAISTDQTDEMKARSLQLVVPMQLHQTFSEQQRNWLMNVSDLLDLVQTRQDSSTYA